MQPCPKVFYVRDDVCCPIRRGKEAIVGADYNCCMLLSVWEDPGGKYIGHQCGTCYEKASMEIKDQRVMARLEVLGDENGGGKVVVEDSLKAKCYLVRIMQMEKRR